MIKIIININNKILRVNFRNKNFNLMMKLMKNNNNNKIKIKAIINYRGKMNYINLQVIIKN